MPEQGAVTVLPPREDKLREVLKSLKLQVFDLDACVQRGAEPECLATIAQNIVLSASVIRQLLAVPELPRLGSVIASEAATSGR